MAITVYPFILATKDEKKKKVLMNHENIHLKQQKELLFGILFYPLYILNTLWNIVRYFDMQKAYTLNMFEVEAYTYEKSTKYLNKRRKFACFRKDQKILDYKKSVLAEKSKLINRISAGILLFSISVFVSVFVLYVLSVKEII